MKCIKLELIRMIRSRGIKAALFIGLLFVISHMILVLKYASLNAAGSAENIPFSSFMFFMGYDMYGWQGVLFLEMAPLLAALPYANSYFTDISEGYIKNIISRKRKKEYLTAKYIAVFISGGIAVIVPLILDIMICTAFLPSYPPLIGTGVFNHIYGIHPCLQIVGFLTIDFFIGGVYAVCTLLVTDLIQNKYLLLIFPYLFMIIWQFAAGLAGVLDCWPVKMSNPDLYTGNMMMYIIVILGMMILTFTVHYIRGMRRDEL